MNEENLQNILQRLTLEELKELQTSVEKYIKSKDMINLYRKNQRKWEKEISKKPKPTQKELDIAKNIKLARHISNKKRNIIKGNLLNEYQITNLSIDDIEFRPNGLDGPYYARMFFEKKVKKNQNKIMFYLIALIALALTVILNQIGLNFNMTNINLLSLMPLTIFGVSIYKGLKLDDIIEYVPKKNLSSLAINNFSKRLKRDYSIEKKHAEETDLNNKLFLESKKDSFEAMIKIHKQIMLEEGEKIAEILNINPSRVDEEVENIDTFVKPVKQKVIRMSK